ncbi:MAG: hypothetical protein JWM95_1560 [Gemmatimonadetes bacterium]|nr:hypothetical protein [Gemmatimonadota bacterium]
MYTTCLFCNGALGTNEVIEHFPVGRRLAFDSAKGRLWVVCRRCERWNLTPLEERWEAVEECERAFQGTRLRVSTDQIGLARLGEGLELVRIGAPLRPEMAAWRYGDQFGRRRRRHLGMLAGGVAAVGVLIAAGPGTGIMSWGAFEILWQASVGASEVYRTRTRLPIMGENYVTLRVRLRDLAHVRLDAQGGRVVLCVPVCAEGAVPWWQFESLGPPPLMELEGETAVRAAGALLPLLNQGSGTASDVQRAVGLLEAGASPEAVFARASGMGTPWKRWDSDKHKHGAALLRTLPSHARLALEMASHEETERRALDGELHLLESAWRYAEEIASIADDLLLPPGAREYLDQHRP